MLKKRTKKIIRAIKNTAAYKARSIDYTEHDDRVVVYNNNKSDHEDFVAIYAILPLTAFKLRIKAYKSKVYLEVK
ncbi:hypothetical protein ACFSTE_04050 [Aquimarina hainanensis]|uniref:KTSC domain-containing protein n=1 Tax=Aquimarina hainanensis TaxID=1578017 RepID=A0ABW5N705_9FLAO|nr:hypothetical protein [Aquimarina sp. TRL1]QKX06009.1 hypothetical protein HN014_14215 [Aquimarina sp. TRL1]